jgi:hypothetical protein
MVRTSDFFQQILSFFQQNKWEFCEKMSGCGFFFNSVSSTNFATFCCKKLSNLLYHKIKEKKKPCLLGHL